MHKEYLENNPEAEKPPSKRKSFAYMPKKMKKQVLDDINYLIGSLIGYTASVAIADYFKRNPAKFKENNEKSFDGDINDILLKESIDIMFDDIIEYQKKTIMESLEKNSKDDKEFDWSDDLEEEHDSIFKQYIEDRQ